MALINVGINFDVRNSQIGRIVSQLNVIRGIGENASASVKKLGTELSLLGKIQNFAAIGTLSTNLVVSARAIGQIAGKLFDVGSSFANAGDKIAKTSRLVGLSVKDYQAFGSLAKDSGMGIEELDSAFQRFNVNLGKARAGDKTALKMFESIMPKSLSNYKTNREVLVSLADGYKKLSSAEQQAFVSQNLFGRSGLKMSEILSSGAFELEKELKDRGNIGYSEEGAKNAEKFTHELQKVQERIDSIKAHAAQELFPTFISLFKKIQEFLDKNGDRVEKSIVKIGKMAAELAERILPKIPGLLEKIVGFVDSFGAGNIAIVGVLGAVGPALLSVLSLIVSIFNFVGKIAPVLVKIKLWIGRIAVANAAVVASVAGVVAIFIGLASIVKQFYDNWEMWSSFVRDDLKNTFGIVGKVLDGLGNGIASFFYFFYELPDLIVQVWNGFWDGLEKIKESFVSLGEGIYDSIVGSVTRAWAAVRETAKKIPIFGNLFAEENPEESSPTLAAQVSESIRSTSTTTTSRFAVDFTNMPRGVSVQAPDQGDFDYSYGYVLGGY